jgi:hypothetical protein
MCQGHRPHPSTSLIMDMRSLALLNNGMKIMLNDLKLRSKSSCFSATPDPLLVLRKFGIE